MTDDPNKPTDQPEHAEAPEEKIKAAARRRAKKPEQPHAAAERPDDEPATEEERLAELRETGEAIGQLAANEELFNRAVEAFRARDAEQFQAVLAAAGVLRWCRLICRWLCSKHCVFVCRKLCGPIDGQDQLDIAEMREFAFVTQRLAQDEPLLRRLIEAVDREDAETYRRIIAELKLERFCHQLCHYLCAVRCRLVCKLLCPPQPQIIKVGYIPRAHINAAGYATGPSSPPGFTPAPNPAGGVGDHPFGGLTHINGAFNITNPFQYKVEFATNPAGPWTPILQPLPDFDIFLNDYTRVPDANGWYDVADMGLGSEGHTYLTDWPTPPAVSDLYYLKLTVRTPALVEFDSLIVPVRLDNTAPTKPVIKLQLKKPDGSVTDLDCCEAVERGDGNTILISVQTSDANFSYVSVDLYGGCNVSLPIVDTGGNSLSKSYNGNLLDTGYPVLTTFEWDPWASNVERCCYLIYVQIWDRAIVTNQFGGRHYNVSWHSITIA